MASGVYINGTLIQIPGVYGFVDASALSGKSVSTNRMAIVGAFPSLEHDAQYEFTAPQSLAAWDPGNLVFARLASLAFGPASDDRIGGASSVTLVNVQTNTQAGYDFPDNVAPTESLKLQARHWGTKGNQVYCKLTSNTDTKLLDVYLNLAGKTETFGAVGSGTLVDLQLDTAVCTQMAAAGSTSLVSFSPTTVSPAADGALTWVWKRQDQLVAGIELVGTYATEVLNQMAVTGTMKFSLNAATPGGCTVTATVIGKDANGLASTKTAVIPPATLANVEVDVGAPESWTQLTSITVAVAGAPLAGSTKYYLHGTAFSLNLAQFSKVTDVCAYINNYANKGWEANNIAPKAGAVPAYELDKQVATSVWGTSCGVRADLWALIQALAGSEIVEASRHDKALYAPYPWNAVAGTKVEQQLLGGTESAVSVATDFADALSQIETGDYQIVTTFSTDILAGVALASSAVTAAILGHERSSYAAYVKNTSIANLFANAVKLLKTRHVSLCAQEIQIAGPTGAAEWVGPEYQAVQAAAMQAGRSVGIPLTNKAPRVLGVRQNWTMQKDDNSVIANGIYAYTQDKNGYKVLRSITTWVQDANPAYVEVSTNESVNTSIRQLRENLMIYVGNPANLSISQLVGIVKGLLAKQVQDGFIRAYRNVVVTQLADKYRIDYDVAPIFALNFFEVTAHVGDF